MEKVRKFEVAKGFEDKGINLPVRKTKYSAGYDIEAAEDVIVLKVEPGSYVSVIALFLQTACKLFVLSSWLIVSQADFNSSVYASYGSFKL